MTPQGMPSYLKGKVANTIRASIGGSKKHKDYIAPEKGKVLYFACLPAHSEHPLDEDDNPSPFVYTKVYSAYQTGDNDVRRWPITTDAYIEAGQDPLYRHAQQLLKKKGDEFKPDRQLGWKRNTKVRVIIQVWLLAVQDSNDASASMLRGKELKDLHLRPLLFSIPAETYTEQFSPLYVRRAVGSDEVKYYDLFGMTTNKVNIIKVHFCETGSEHYQYKYVFERTTEQTDISSMRDKVLDLTSHETMLPHTVEELQGFLRAALSIEETTTAGGVVPGADYEEEPAVAVMPGAEYESEVEPKLPPDTDVDDTGTGLGEEEATCEPEYGGLGLGTSEEEEEVAAPVEEEIVAPPKKAAAKKATAKKAKPVEQQELPRKSLGDGEEDGLDSEFKQ